MSFKEIVDSGAGQFMATQQFEQAGITLVDNTPEEIRDVVLEMANGTAVHWRDDLENRARQEKFWQQFPNSISPFNGKPLHGEIRMRIGSKFLEGYQ